MKLDLEDLEPRDTEFELSEHPGKKYTLKKVTLRTRIWLKQNFHENNRDLAKIFNDQKLEEISEIAYHLLKEKEAFPTLEDFQDAFVTQQDFVTLIKSMLTTIGISEPLIDKLSKEYDSGNESSLSQPTGAPSTT